MVRYGIHIRADRDFIKMVRQTKALLELRTGDRLSDARVTRLIYLNTRPEDIINGYKPNKIWGVKWN